MIRYYESIGSSRSGSAEQRIPRLLGGPHQPPEIPAAARSLGFSVPQIQELMTLWSDRNHGNAAVRALALGQAAELEAKALRLQEMTRTLRRLTRACQHRDRPRIPDHRGRDLPRGRAERSRGFGL
ncbi:MAG: MerR family DNA-binding protein [Pseudomonadota bacterium]